MLNLNSAIQTCYDTKKTFVIISHLHSKITHTHIYYLYLDFCPLSALERLSAELTGEIGTSDASLSTFSLAGESVFLSPLPLCDELDPGFNGIGLALQENSEQNKLA